MSGKQTEMLIHSFSHSVISSRLEVSAISCLKCKKFMCRPEDYLQPQPNIDDEHLRTQVHDSGTPLTQTRTEEKIEKFKVQVKTLLFADTTDNRLQE